MTAEAVRIAGARHHNLKNIDVAVPLGRIVLWRGPSGSGKTSLALGTVWAESRHRLSQTLSGFSATVEGKLPRPDVDHIEGVPPALAITEPRAHPLSTAGSLADVDHGLALLLSRHGDRVCGRCGTENPRRTRTQLLEHLTTLPADTPVTVSIPLGPVQDVGASAAHWSRQGFSRALVASKPVRLDQLVKKKRGSEVMSIVVDRLREPGSARVRLGEALDLAVTSEVGIAEITWTDQTQGPDLPLTSSVRWSDGRKCIHCTAPLADVTAQRLSFRHPDGACDACLGTGEREGRVCTVCGGDRLKPLDTNVRWGGRDITQWRHLSLRQLHDALSGQANTPGVKALVEKLRPAIDLGVGHVTVIQAASSLSRGERKLLHLAGLWASPLAGVLYILDEPLSGLDEDHIARVAQQIRRVHALGNSVWVIEHRSGLAHVAHDEVLLGPGAGPEGGTIVRQGVPQPLQEGALPSPMRKRKPSSFTVTTDDTRIPLGDGHVIHFHRSPPFQLRRLVGITGVNGVGKTVFLQRVLPAALPKGLPTVTLDRSPLSKSSRSSPATHTGALDDIRKLFAALPLSRARGYSPGRFSPNSREGRCPRCEGHGFLTHDLGPLGITRVTCDLCHGSRFLQETLDVRYRGHHIGQILEMTVAQAADVFAQVPSLAHKLESLIVVGLQYLVLGQPAHELSGGESQRVRIAGALHRMKKKNGGLFILEEPCAGLHPSDMGTVLGALQRLVDQGQSVWFTEHQRRALAECDQVMVLKADDEGHRRWEQTDIPAPFVDEHGGK